MSTRKKKAGFNPRSNARKETRLNMAQFFGAVDKYEAQVKVIGERIETEREQIHQRAGNKKEKALAALEAAYAVFLALVSKNKERIDALIRKADATGVETLEMTRNTDIPWVDLKIVITGQQAEIGEHHGEILLMLQEYTLVITTIFTMYENYSIALRDAADAAALELPDFQAEFEKMVKVEKEYAEEVSEEDDEGNTRESRALDATVATLVKPETVEEV